MDKTNLSEMSDEQFTALFAAVVAEKEVRDVRAAQAARRQAEAASVLASKGAEKPIRLSVANAADAERMTDLKAKDLKRFVAYYQRVTNAGSANLLADWYASTKTGILYKYNEFHREWRKMGQIKKLVESHFRTRSSVKSLSTVVR